MKGNQPEPGSIPQTIQFVFEAVYKVQLHEFLLRSSYIEIYNEKVNDLLEKDKTGLKLREVEATTIICGVKQEVVHTPDKIMQLMKRGEYIWCIGETNMNECSSWSHTIFRIIIESCTHVL
jgi:urease gamma subunit